MITLKNFGIHKDVPFATFGSGDIAFSRAKLNDKSMHTLLIFSNNQTPRKIGEVSNDDLGKSTDELEKPQIVFEFTKPESITALVHSLLELQKNLFDEN